MGDLVRFPTPRRREEPAAPNPKEGPTHGVSR